MTPERYGLAADAILALHFAFVAFVVGGLILIVVGGVVGWRVARDLRFRIAHFAAIVFVVIESWAGIVCPLTEWESALRVRAGEHGYPDSFIATWLDRMLYVEASPRTLTIAYTAFAAAVVATWVWLPLRRV